MSDSEVLHIKVQGEVHELDFGALTWGELADIEQMLGSSLEEANLATANGVVTLAFVAMRKSNPSVTVESLRALPMSEIVVVEAERPTKAVDGGGAAEQPGNQS